MIPETIHLFKYVSSRLSVFKVWILIVLRSPRQALSSIPSSSSSSQASLSTPYTRSYESYHSQIDSVSSDAQDADVSSALHSSSASSGRRTTDYSTTYRNRSRQYEANSRRRLRESGERLERAIYDRGKPVASTRREFQDAATDLIMFVYLHLIYIFLFR